MPIMFIHFFLRSNNCQETNKVKIKGYQLVHHAFFRFSPFAESF